MGPKSKELPRRRKKVTRKQLRVAPYFVSLLVLTALVWLGAMAGVGFTNVPVPKLGLDLQGGMTMTLKASLPGGGTPSADKLEQARQIIVNRVNGTGVAEPEVFVEGNDHIVVNVAGKEANADKLREVGAPAELRFREVMGTPQEDYTKQDPEDFKKRTQEGADDKKDKDKDDGKKDDGKKDDKEKASSSASKDGKDDKKDDKSSDSPSDEASQSDKKGKDPAEVDETVKERRAEVEKKLGKDLVQATDAFVQQAAAVIKGGQPLSPQMLPQLGYTKEFAKYGELAPDEVAVLAPQWQYFVPNIGCGQLSGRTPGAISSTDQQVVACNTPSKDEIKSAKKEKKSAYAKYLLAKSSVVGKDVSSASVQMDQQKAGAYAVGINFTNDGAGKWKKLANKTVGKEVAIVLDNEIVSAPTIQEGAASGGSVEITGDFTSDEANLLSEQLKYGSLPASFSVETIDEVSPTLGIEQLEAGLLAGGLGLLLVILYCLAYYRVLGFVVIASLAAATLVLYPTVSMLGEQIGLTLTLAGVAGFIVSVGVTADSFVVFFERLKDEIKEGRSVLSSVPRAWVRARRTIISASVVNTLCAVVLYMLGIGAVKGFAFALGLSTVVDVALVFLFTHPLVAWMSRGRILRSVRMSGIHTASPSTAGPGLRSGGTPSLKES